MNIATSMVKKIRITELENLDPLTVIAENFGKGSGKIIIECFGESWSHYWSHKYLCKIIPVVKDAFHSLSQAVAA